MGVPGIWSNSINVWQGPLFLLTLCQRWVSAVFGPAEQSQQGQILLLEGIVFDLECLSAHRCPSDGVCHQPGDYMYLSWVSSCGCVLPRCVQQENACRGESLRKERDTLNCPGISMFYNHVSDDHVDLSALLNKDVPRLHIFAHRPPLWALKPK